MEWSLYLFSILGSGMGFLAQMLVSGYWTTAYSHDVFHFSVNLAFYFLALGIGSLLSGYWKHPSLRGLGILLWLLALVLGLCIPFLRWGISHFGNVVVLPLGVVTIAGFMNGMVIPLCLRLGKDCPRISLATLFFIDYSSAILFTLVFSFVLLIPLGFMRTALVLSLTSSLVVALTLSLVLPLKEVWKRGGVPVFILMLSFPLLGFYYSHSVTAPTMNSSGGAARLLYSEQSHYQKIVLTEEAANDPYLSAVQQHVLYLDGFVQFSTIDEQNYHACLVNIPMAASGLASSAAKKALVLGGGDGLAVRNLLTNPKIQKITIVELDPAMIRLSRENSILRTYNVDSMHNPRVEIIVNDAFRWVQEAKLKGERYDIMVVDFPAPKNLTLARLFAAEFYLAAFQLLNKNGFAAIQAGPSYSWEDPQHLTLSKVTSSIIKTIRAIGYTAFPYVTPNDSEAFVLATANAQFDMTGFSRTLGILTGGNVGSICRYDPQWKFPEVEINTLNTLKLSTYMLDWFQQAGQPFFYYRGNHMVFLPE